MALKSKEPSTMTEDVPLSTETKTFFPTLECDYEESIYDHLPENAEILKLNDLSDEDEYYGQPLMTGIQTFNVDEDGEEVQKHRIQFYIIDNDEEAPQALQINLNLKSGDDIQVNIRKGSVLFDFIASLRELEVPGSMSGINIIKKASMKEFTNFINDLGRVNIEVMQRSISNGILYNSFKFKEVTN